MSLVNIEHRGPIAMVRMQRGVTNAIDLELVEALKHAIDEVLDSSRALVLTGGFETKFFSIGLDLPQMLVQDRSTLRHFWDLYNGLCHDLYTLPLPTVSAIVHHAIAGGTILSLMTDRRVIATGRTLMGLNEVKLGLPVPLLPHLIVRDVAGERAATEIVYKGELHGPEDALRLGLVDEVCSSDEVENRAIRWAEGLCALPHQAFAAIKRIRTSPVSAAFLHDSDGKIEEFLDCWFSPEAQPLLQRAAETF